MQIPEKKFSRIIPDWDTIKNFPQPLTDGEINLIKYLDENLQIDIFFHSERKLIDYNGWLIFVQPYLNGSRPDIIIFHPKVGVQIFEVKDWELNHYNFQKDNKGKLYFYVSDSRGNYQIKSPKKQVEYYKKKLTGVLIPNIGEKIDESSRNYGLIKTAVYFDNASTQRVQELFKVEDINFKVFPFFGKDFLSKEKLDYIVPASKFSNSKFWNTEWNEEILFWLKPPLHSLEQTVKLSLNNAQKKFSEPLEGHHRIRGVAGSGKTQVLAYRAGKLASQGYKVLILTFNITLWHYVRDMIQRSPFEFSWKQFIITHFHGFCNDILNDFGEKWPDEQKGEDVYKLIVPEMVLNLVKKSNNEKYKFDVILIDEGQDYYIEWYQMLKEFLSDRDELVVVCDKKQNIYGRELDWLDKRRSGMEKFGEWIELKKNVRLPEDIAVVTNQFSETFNLNQEVKAEPPDLFNQNDSKLIWWNVDFLNWLAKIDEAYELIKKMSSSHSSDIVILLPDKYLGFVCVEHFKSFKKIDINHVFEDESEKVYHLHKKAFWPGDGRLKMCTIHSFKGWEAKNVIMLIPRNFQGSTELYDRMVYTAMTRTKVNLIVVNCNERYKIFGEEQPSTW